MKNCDYSYMYHFKTTTFKLKIEKMWLFKLKSCDYSYKYIFKLTTFKLKECDHLNWKDVTIQIDFQNL